MLKTNLLCQLVKGYSKYWGCHVRGRDHMVVGFTTTYAISAYNH